MQWDKVLLRISSFVDALFGIIVSSGLMIYSTDLCMFILESLSPLAASRRAMVRSNNLCYILVKYCTVSC